MCDDLMCPVDLTFDHAVAAVHLCLDFLPRAETTNRAGEVITKVRWVRRGERIILNPHACC